MPDRTLTIDSVESIFPLRQEIRRGVRRRFNELKVAVPQMSKDENKAWGQRLGRSYFSCGCAEGTALGLVGLLGYAGWAVARTEPLAWTDLLWLLGAFFLASGLGKLFGLARARWTLATAIDDLDLLLLERKAHRPPRPGEHPPEPSSRRLCAVGAGDES